VFPFLYFSSPCFFFISFCALQLCHISAVQAKGRKTLDISIGVADGPQLHDRGLGFWLHGESRPTLVPV